MAGQSVFMMEVSKGGQGGTPLPTTSLQTKSESVIVGYTHSKNVVNGFAPTRKENENGEKQQSGYELCKS